MLKLEKTVRKIRIVLKKFPIFESICNFLYRLLFAPDSVRSLKFGFCPVCGKKTIMLISSYNLRETGNCLFCSANTRYKVVAELIKRIIIIKSIFKDLDKVKLNNLLYNLDLTGYPLKSIVEIIKSKNFWIYEPSSFGVIYNSLKAYPKFVYSEYFPRPNLKGGQYFKGIRFEDLQSLSFKNNSIDLIITQDVFEHVANYYLAFKEIYRVLKPKGIHIFTVPIGKNKKTLQFFDDKGNLLINKVVFHVDPLRKEGAKVYTQFGSDIIDILNDINFSSFLYHSEINSKIGIFSKIKVIISIKED